MSYCTQIKAGGITNLTTARFFASYQVDWLGFALDPLAAKAITLNKAQDMLGWLAHDGLVGEFDNRAADEILHLSDLLGLRGVQIPYSMPANVFRAAGLTVFRHLRLDIGSLPLALDDRDTDYLVLDIPSLPASTGEVQMQVRQWCEDYRIFLQLPTQVNQVVPAVHQWHPAGVAIQTDDEIRPGVQEFDNMLQILEALEE